MQRNDEQRRAGLAGGTALLAATGLMTALLVTGASAARHHARHHARPHAHHHARPHARHHARHYSRRASSGGGEAYGEGIESSLAGIRIGDSYRTVLARFGNPSETQLEQIQLVAAGSAGAGNTNGAGGGTRSVPVKIFVGPNSSTGGGASSPSTPSGGSSGGLLGALGALGGGSLFQSLGGFPGGSPGGFPGGSPGGFPGGAGGGGAAGGTIKPEHPEYRWIYDEPYSNSLEFTFSPGGSVIQIRATGYRGFVHTNRGIQLGVKFSQVLLAYGNPEKQDYDGPILSADYTDRSHVGFQFFNQRLVGITVASVE